MSRCCVGVFFSPSAGHDSVQDPEHASLEGLESINRNDGWGFQAESLPQLLPHLFCLAHSDLLSLTHCICHNTA